ncbi:hypothetical protein H4696_008918 [Amycolatopsis lexingtonensis]|uniref:Beta-ketoacyl synthase N-terminal domain-containing protein n=2 Tax=Amycolatopsis lexingtonensis TaxID=218822 RepID=A0ABR9IF63_9PSEU|nr:ketosynthase [Amycolatopsis lexingtonensis]MBE1501818.1 hypothetical protein [Amycolatopsis lexingtonensis]
MSAPAVETTAHRLVAAAFLAPAGTGPDGAAGEPVKLPKVPGFVESSFSPLVRAVVAQCLAGVTGGEPLGAEGARTALVLATTFGDAATADLGSKLLAAGQVANPLLFYQSVPTTILGVVARDFGITGPTMCFSARHDLRGEALDLVDLLLADGEVDQVLLVGADLGADARARRVAEELAPLPLAQADTAVAFLFRRGGQLSETAHSIVDGGKRPEFGALAGLVELYAAAVAATNRILSVPLETAWGRRSLDLLLDNETGGVEQP